MIVTSTRGQLPLCLSKIETSGPAVGHPKLWGVLSKDPDPGRRSAATVLFCDRGRAVSDCSAAYQIHVLVAFKAPL